MIKYRDFDNKKTTWQSVLYCSVVDLLLKHRSFVNVWQVDL